MTGMTVRLRTRRCDGVGWVAVGLLRGNLARDPPRRGGLDVVAVRAEAVPTPQAHRTAPYLLGLVRTSVNPLSET